MRELVIGLIAVLLAYLLWLVLRWFRLTRKAHAARMPVELREPILPAEDERAPHQAPKLDVHADDDDDGNDIGDEDEAAAKVTLYAKPRPPAEPDASAFGFDALLEVRQSRHLVDALTQDLATLKQEVQQLRQELTDIRAASRVSPQYGEAVALARRGLDASAIAERCGISVAEAELVRSLLAMSPSGD